MGNEVKRMRYFDGLFLKADEFNLEQNYHIKMRRLHNRYLHSWGIVWGLEVVPGPGSKEVTVKEGMALNKVSVEGEELSQEIVLASDTPVDLSSYNPKDGLYIYIRYLEDPADIVEAKGGAEKIHWLEGADIKHSEDKPAKENENIILAKVVIKDDNTIDATSIYDEEDGNPLRRYAGFSGKVLEAEQLILAISGITTGLASIEGKKFVDLKGIQINSAMTNFAGPLTVEGKVGIGLTDPKARLHVEATNRPTIMAQGNFGGLMSGAGGGHGVFGTNLYVDSGNQLRTAGADTSYGYSGMHATWGNINFYARDGNTFADAAITPVPRLFIRGSDGNVGIGTTSLSEKLEVNGKVKALGFVGDGSLITSLNGSQITAGTIADARIPGTITRESRFDPTAGHKHTGVAGDGPIIPHSNLGNILAANTASTDTIAIKHVSDALTKGWQDHIGITSGNPHGTTAAQLSDYLAKRKWVQVTFGTSDANGATRTASVGFVPKLVIVTGGFYISMGGNYGDSTSGAWAGGGGWCPAHYIYKYSSTNIQTHSTYTSYIFYVYGYWYDTSAGMTKAKAEALYVYINFSQTGDMTLTLNRSVAGGADPLDSFAIYLALICIG